MDIGLLPISGPILCAFWPENGPQIGILFSNAKESKPPEMAPFSFMHRETIITKDDSDIEAISEKSRCLHRQKAAISLKNPGADARAFMAIQS
jgi:hypothetical protein